MAAEVSKAVASFVEDRRLIDDSCDSNVNASQISLGLGLPCTDCGSRRFVMVLCGLTTHVWVRLAKGHLEGFDMMLFDEAWGWAGVKSPAAKAGARTRAAVGGGGNALGPSDARIVGARGP